MNNLFDNGAVNKMTAPCLHCEAQVLPSEKELEVLVKTMEISENELTPQEIYRERLDICNECEYLQENVVCRECGCYVKIRALYRDNQCPNPYGRKW